MRQDKRGSRRNHSANERNGRNKRGKKGRRNRQNNNHASFKNDSPDSPEAREDRVEGRHPFLEAVKAGRTIDKIWLQSGLHFDQDIEDALDEAKEAGAVVLSVEKAGLDRLSDGRNHQGIVAQIAMRPYLDLDELIEEAAKSQYPLLVIADELRDPHNLGALLRVIDACGAQGLILPKRRSAGLDAIVAKASAGAVEHVPVAKVPNLQQAVDQLKESGYWILAADMDGENLYTSETFDSLSTTPLALVLGNEGKGVAPKLQEHCDLVLQIPMEGIINSLNVSVAGAVILFEIQRRRQEKLVQEKEKESKTR